MVSAHGPHPLCSFRERLLLLLDYREELRVGSFVALVVQVELEEGCSEESAEAALVEPSLTNSWRHRDVLYLVRTSRDRPE
jgi:hypothetical protein